MIYLRASSIHRIMQCPQSAMLEQQVEKGCQVQYAEDAAERGRQFHKASELVLNGKTLLKAMKTAGIEQSDDWLTAKNTISFYTKYVKKIAKKRKIFTEQRTNVDFEGCKLTAQYDALVVDPGGGEMDLFDLKTGSWDYEKAFDQLYFTSCLLYIAHYLNSTWELRMHIVQPNNRDKQVLTKVMLLTSSDVNNHLTGIITNIKETMNYHQGEHCTFCPALPICPEHHKEVMIMNTDILLPENISDENLEQIIIKRKRIEKFLSACEEYAKNKLEKGHVFDKLYISTSKGHRKWIDPEATKKKLIEQAPLSEITDTKLKSPAQIEKLLGREAIEGLTEQPEYKKISVRENLFEVIE